MRIRDAAALVLATAIALAVRWHGLLSWPLTFDEGATWYFAHLAPASLWGPRAILETNPPLFYGLEHMVLRFGGGPGTLRLISAAAGALCVPAAAAIATSLADASAGILAAFLIAMSPVCIGASQDARTYALLTLAALLAILAELHLLAAYADPDRPDRVTRRWWLLYTIASITALYLHNTAILMVLALNLVAAFSMIGHRDTRRAFAADWITVNAIIAMAYALWVPVVLFQTRHTLAAVWLTVPSLADLRFAIFNVYAAPDVHILQPAADLLLLAAGLAGIAALLRDRIPATLALFVIAGVPAMTWLVSQWRPIMNGKTLLWLAPLFLVFVAIGCLRARRFAWPVAVMLVAVQVLGSASHFQNRWDEAFPEVAAVLADQVRDGDAIYLDPPSQATLLDLYGWPRQKLRLYAPPGPDPWFYNLAITPAAITTVAGTSRLWVLTRAKSAEQIDLAHQLPNASQAEDLHFGHGTLRNATLRNLELSLLVRRMGVVSGLRP